MDHTFDGVGDLATIDAERRLLAALRASIREHGDEPGTRQADELIFICRPVHESDDTRIRVS